MIEFLIAVAVASVVGVAVGYLLKKFEKHMETHEADPDAPETATVPLLDKLTTAGPYGHLNRVVSTPEHRGSRKRALKEEAREPGSPTPAKPKPLPKSMTRAERARAARANK